MVFAEITILVPYRAVKLLLLIQHQPQSGWNTLFLVSNEGVVFVSFLALIVSKVFAYANVPNSKQSIVMLGSANHIIEFKTASAFLRALKNVVRICIW